MNMQDIVFSDLTRKLLEENGRMDAATGKDMETGWREICSGMGYDYGRRTPAEEAYKDGYYSYRKS